MSYDITRIQSQKVMSYEFFLNLPCLSTLIIDKHTNNTIEEYVFDTDAEKTTVLSCHRCLINIGVEKMNNI